MPQRTLMSMLGLPHNLECSTRNERSDYLELSCKSKRLSFFFIGELEELVEVEERLRGGASAAGEEERERLMRDECVHAKVKRIEFAGSDDEEV